jgi:subtilase family serine protease
MKGVMKLVAPLAAALVIAACNGGASNAPGMAGTTGMSGQSVLAHLNHPAPDWVTKHQADAVCPQVLRVPTCLALVAKTTGGVKPPVAGWAPIDFQTRYNLPISNGSGQIVAIVDAYDNPNIASDLAAYRSNFGLGTATFNKYNQNGQQSNYPAGSTGWGLEEDLDVDMVSAACPKCTIYLIEANSNSVSDLEAAEDTAAGLAGVHIISNSWICYGSHNCGDSSFFTHFAKSGVLYLAASGDAGYDQNGAPETGTNIVSVGGTQLAKSGSTYSETIWNGAGGGCSNNGSGSGETKPSWQHDPSCTQRTDSDIAAEAGCSPGVAEYDSYGYSGWITVCGTSAASPLNAAVFGLKGNASTQTGGKAFWAASKKKRHKALWYISVGNNGSCGGSYLCQAGTNQFGTYSGPGGWGTPKGDGLY